MNKRCEVVHMRISVQFALAFIFQILFNMLTQEGNESLLHRTRTDH